MKFAFMNGWKDAPHCWRYYLYKNVFKYEKNPAFSSISLFGFVIFFYR